MSYGRLLWTLTHAPAGSDLRALVDELEDRLERDPPDELTRRELAATLARRGLDARGLDAVWTPGVGEGYVLLTGAAGGSVGRATVRRAGPPHAIAVRLPNGSAPGGRAFGQACVVFSALVDALARRGTGVPHAGERGHEITLSSDGAHLDGSSLGAAIAAAVVSCWLGRAPRADVAVSAALDTMGSLLEVRDIAPKVAALATSYPRVTRVVVAREQDPKELRETAGIALCRCGTIDEVLAETGLSLDDVEGTLLPASMAEQQIRALSFEHVEDYSAATWRTLAMRARWLAAHPRVGEGDRVTARAFAALFHLHAGDDGEARTLAASIEETAIADLGGAGRAWTWIIKATSAIDVAHHDDARAWAQRAVAEARALGRAEKRECLGRALGTLGRALLHAGEDEAALPYLREAAEHHQAQLPREAARSWNTLAMALRRATRHAEALEALEEARRAVDASVEERGSLTSTLFLDYELGRVLFELERWDEARVAFERVALRQRENDYPRVGCLRYLATIDASRADPRAREWMGEALRIAETNRGILGSIAATATMAVLHGGVLDDLRARAAAAWADRGWDEPTSERVRSVVREIAY